MKEEKTKKKFNKKLLMFGLPLFALVLVSAGLIIHYAQVQQDINIESPISDNSEEITELSGYLQSPQLGTLVSAENLALFDVNVNVNSVVTPTEDITTSYVGTLRLSQKVVAFETNNWAEVPNTNVMVKYTVVGDTLLAEVVNEDKVTDYVLIYYADNADRFNNVAKAVIIGDVDASLPYEGDANADSEVYDYCTEEEAYYTCNGAKVWYVPSNSIDVDGNLDWAKADKFYFETNLIHYFKTVDGNTVIPEGVSMEFYPLYEFGGIEGDYTVTTSVVPA